MMTDKILTIESIPTYLAKHSRSIGIPSGVSMTVSRITGGNVNFAFRVALSYDDADGVHRASDSLPSLPALFVKQAPEYVAIFGPDGYPLTSDRMRMEMDVYSEWKEILGEEAATYLPSVLFFDDECMVTVMKFLENYDLLDHIIVSPSLIDSASILRIGSKVGSFLARVHSGSHSVLVGEIRAANLSRHFVNRSMRDIQLEFVFTKCFKEATDEQRVGLGGGGTFMEEVEALRREYNGEIGTANAALCHGDLHPGSVMVSLSDGDVKVIDPDFTVYGPPGLDVGSLLSGFVLGVIHQVYSKNSDAAVALCEAAECIWTTYAESMGKGALPPLVVQDIEVQAVGFTVMEVCRTALGFAGGRVWLQFDDSEVQKMAKRRALELVTRCMVGRHDKGMELLIGEIKTIAASG